MDEVDTLEHDDTFQPTEEHGESAADALALVRDDLAAAEAARQSAEQRATAAEATAQTAQEIALNAAITAEKSALDKARAAYKAAREAGDIDAEQSAVEDSALARQRLESLEGQKAQAGQRRAAPPPQQQVRVPSQAVRAWFAEHPEIDTNPQYAQAATEAHHAAVAAGIEPESAQYFKFCNSRLEQQFGPNHGKGQGPMRQTPSQPPQQTPQRQGPRASSVATPPARGSSNTGRTGSDINSIAAALNSTPEQIREFADISGMSLEKYLQHQTEILAERKRSGGARDVQFGDGAVYR